MKSENTSTQCTDISTFKHDCFSVLNLPVVFFVFCSLFFGILMLVVTPPFQAPDEYTHFYRAWQISQGDFMPKSLNAQIPADLCTATRSFVYLQFQSHRKTSVDYIMANIKGPHKGMQEYENVCSPTFVYHPVSYLSSGAGVALAARFNLPTLISSYMARLFNLLTYTAIIAVALMLLPVLKWEMAFIALLPMSLFQGASVSADSMNIALNLFMFACVIRIMHNQQTTRRDWAMLAVGTFLVACVRPIYALSALLSFLYRRKFPGHHFYLQFGIPLLASLLIAISWVFLNPAPAIPMAGHNVDEALRSLVEQPLMLLFVPLATIRDLGAEYFSGFVGVLGWLDVYLPRGLYSVYFILFAFMALGMCSVECPLSRWTRLLALALFVLYSASMILGLYVFFPNTSKTIAGGVQGRYFLPMAPLLFLVFQKREVRSGDCPKRLARLRGLVTANGPLILATGVFFGLTITVCELIERYYPTKRDAFVTTIVQSRNDSIAGEIIDGIVVEQSFKALGNSIDSITLHLATFARANRGHFMLEVIDNQGKLVTETPIEIDMKAIRGGKQWHSFVNKPIMVIPGEPYRLRVSSPQARSGNAVTWYKSQFDTYPDGCAFINGEPQVGDMTFAIRFSTY